MCGTEDVTRTSRECLYCSIEREDVNEDLQLGMARGHWDDYPVAPGHFSVFPRRHTNSFFEITEPEISDMYSLAARMQDVLADTISPAGYTVGVNDGRAAGQSIPHVHMHVIPRWHGDVQDAAGGVRSILPTTRGWPPTEKETIRMRKAPQAPVADCRFCLPLHPWRIVQRTPSFMVMAGLGAIEPGYFLILARDHYGSMAELPSSLHAEFLGLLRQEQCRQSDIFGASRFFEHGRNGGCLPGGRGESLCEHAHIHLAATEHDILSLARQHYPFDGPRTWDELWEGQVGAAANYVLIQDGERLAVELEPTSLPKRYLRSLWSTCVTGDGHLGDWEAFPRFDSVRDALAQYFRTDSPSNRPDDDF